uniref:VDE lipocalin domain-containing protein n=1 Tax=Chromera velia CCMP2878 TaxID=1169474 RepID=A0A0G4G5V1_9ALVE|mmetsp:Transcript_13334/g.26353  ORF Transcript_13334/g.26353 Transcript_13334/m.26353 type:complete len:196 (+) Transcript_13334:111-698(+)|eukprot:Cvel_20401.t1-p1 / transcript=Cvel_20401.t1 / gene=Cvel_20401 / organism=Chromera_velia_CCMP2878 / gene_product=hypothetical protein / transcript_product=hypothetical protein / location=Cvel_scaffold1827:17429-18431(+) / protein_length=195 / sequence_SO=supercontig / SO=protein_coding / is_pseudo=false
MMKLLAVSSLFLAGVQADFLDRMQQAMCRAARAGNMAVLENTVGISNPMSYVCCDICDSRVSAFGSRAVDKCKEDCSPCSPPAEECLPASSSLVQTQGVNSVCAATQIACGKNVARPSAALAQGNRCVNISQQQCLSEFRARVDECVTTAGGQNNDFGRCGTEARFKDAYEMVIAVPCMLFARQNPSASVVSNPC